MRIKIAIRSIYMLTGKIVDEKDEKKKNTTKKDNRILTWALGNA